MVFKFIFVVLVISAARGEQTVSQKLISSGVHKALPLATIKPLDIASVSQGEVVADLLKNDTSEIQNSKGVSSHETPKMTEEPVLRDSASKTAVISETPTRPTTANTTQTTTPTPTTPPPASDSEGKWIVKNETGGICIVAQLELQFNVTYLNMSDNMENITITVPKNSTASGDCSDSNQRLQLKWNDENFLTVVFGLNKTSNKYEIVSLNLTISLLVKNAVPEKTSMVFMSNKSDVPAIPVKMSYRCDKEQMQVLNSTTNKSYAKMYMRHTQLEAFMTKKSASFSEAKDCEGFETPDIVPVAVGCVLCILVGIVLIAYLIGRRRSQSRGYLSMWM